MQSLSLIGMMRIHTALVVVRLLALTSQVQHESAISMMYNITPVLILQ
jgi:hypothetical protein